MSASAKLCLGLAAWLVACVPKTGPALVTPGPGERAVAVAAVVASAAPKPNSDAAQVLGHGAGWQAEHDRYAPDVGVVARLRAALGARADLRVTVVYGDWCGDSRVNTPRFAKLWRALGEVATRITYWNVDRRKQEPTGYTARYLIRKVPTFVIEQGEREVGRIIEWPSTSLEADLLEIVGRTKAP